RKMSTLSYVIEMPKPEKEAKKFAEETENEEDAYEPKVLKERNGRKKKKVENRGSVAALPPAASASLGQDAFALPSKKRLFNAGKIPDDILTMGGPITRALLKKKSNGKPESLNDIINSEGFGFAKVKSRANKEN